MSIRSRRKICLKFMVSWKRWLAGPISGRRTIRWKCSFLLLTIRSMTSAKPRSARPVSSTVRASVCCMESRTRLTTDSFHHPCHARCSSVSMPSPVALRTFESCHQPPFANVAWLCSIPIVPPCHTCLFGKGLAKTGRCQGCDLASAVRGVKRVLSKS